MFQIILCFEKMVLHFLNIVIQNGTFSFLFLILSQVHDFYIDVNHGFTYPFALYKCSNVP